MRQRPAPRQQPGNRCRAIVAVAFSLIVMAAGSASAGNNAILMEADGGTGRSALGSTGRDYSANKPALPVIGGNFGGSGPYANYVLIATAPAHIRNNIDIENNSGAQIVVVRDDGTAATGSAPVNASVFSLGGGSGVGSQGGAWSSLTFRGRLQIYAASSTAQVDVRED